MKKITLSGLFILIWGATSCFGVPWWNTAVAGILAAWFFRLSPAAGFAAGMAAGSLLWWGAAMAEHIPNGGILATRVGVMLKGLKAWHLLTLTGFLGGLLAGMGGVVGGHLQGIFKKKSPFSE
ncbi:MAG: hypothetical protein SFV52_14095 [Saprospiraceae bacterium]|nr:hypothetical protein [Saprospiraceae bacterium]